MIRTLAELKNNVTFLKLDGLQSKLDDNNKVMREANFTRSPFQLLSFLITYAGLDSTKRQQVVNNLPKEADFPISKEELDLLLQEIDWAMILKKDPNSALIFNFSVALGSPDEFYKSIKENCSALSDILGKNDCIIKINQGDHVIFTTQVEETVSWKKSFSRGDGKRYWEVPHFTLSKELKRAIEVMPLLSEKTLSGFSIEKGNCEDIKLHIKAPVKTNEYRSETKSLELNNDPLYKSFVGITNFYGLDSVDDVDVTLSNVATFSDKGASASQTLVVDFSMECATMTLEKPTIITINDLHVLYEGIGVGVSLGEGEKKDVLIDSKDVGQYFISLPINEKEAGVGVSLYSSKLGSFQRHLLTSNSEIVPQQPVLAPQEQPALPPQESSSVQRKASSVEVDFYEKVKLLRQEMTEFSKPSLNHKYEAAKTLYEKLNEAGNTYFSQPQTDKSYQHFKSTCQTEIAAAKKVLGKHSNWNKILLSILAIVLTAGVVVVVDLAINKRFTLFSTNSTLKINSIEKTIDQVAPSAAPAPGV